MTINHKGSLMTYHHNGEEVSLGFLMNFKDHGIYDAALGKVEVTPEEAEKHNSLLSEAQIKGLDENCKVGMKGTFYFIGGRVVQTWLGTLVSDQVQRVGWVVTFTRKGMTFRGRLRKDDDSFTFTRIA